MVNRRSLGFLLWVLLGWVGLSARTALAQPAATGKSIGFSNLVFRLAGRDEVGIADQDFRVHILEDLRARGINAVGAENLVFGNDRGAQADLMLGGTVKELECRSGADYGNISCSMGVEWQVLDVGRDTVVYKLLTRARVLEHPKEPTATLGKHLVAANLESLGKHAEFRKLLAPQTEGTPTQGYARATLRACKTPPRAMPAASEQVLDATVLVQTSGGFGSGFLVGPGGFVVTAAHVVPESSATIKLRDGRQFPATVIRVERRIDIALLRLGLPEGVNLPCLPSKLTPVAVGADVYAVGSPASRDLSFSLARGIVSGVRLLQGLQYLQTDAAVNSGNSGGPLVTGSGEAAAIVSYKLVGVAVEGIAFGVPLAGGLDAIGVTLGNGYTSPELTSAAAVPAQATKLFVDKADPVAELGPPPGPRDTSVQGVGGRKTSPVVKRSLYTWGGTLLGLGATFVLAAIALDPSDGGTNSAPNTHLLRNIGIGSAVVGGGMIGIGLALP